MMDPGIRLMERLRTHDVDAFEQLYDGYHRLVFGIGVRMLQDPDMAEDLTQAVFLTLWTAPDAFRGGSFVPWLARLSRNRALDMLRTRSHGEGEVPPDLPLEGGLDDEVFGRLDEERVRDALAALSLEQRMPIEAGFFGGVTHEEIARRIDVPADTVKTRVRAGLRKLRERLGERVSK
jgi:RNA polymerase sigma-70 factor (ECF subfamily)